jgi:Protein of unknown function (DUF3618)
MDQDQSNPGQELADEQERTAAAEQERTPEQVREEIEQARVELGDTVAALAEKTDVKAQAQHAVQETKETVRGKVSGVKETAADKKDELLSSAREVTPDSADDAGRRITAFASENSLPLAALAAFGLGLLIGKRRAR